MENFKIFKKIKIQKIIDMKEGNNFDDIVGIFKIQWSPSNKTLNFKTSYSYKTSLILQTVIFWNKYDPVIRFFTIYMTFFPPQI